MVFDPDYQEIDCPKCLQRRIYFDREIGFYCMSCGRRFSAQEIAVLIEKAELASPSRHSGKSGEKYTAKIDELPPRKTKKTQRVSHDTAERKKPEQQTPDS
jgi:ribosome-binding protein aMBF1 (putative translation factor)